MISANGWEARFKFTGKTIDDKPRYDRMTVAAWDDEGYALVVDKTSGTLRPARSYGNFAGLTEANEHHQIIPGGGWLTEWKGEDGEPNWIEPVLAWRIDSEGWGEAIFTAGDGGAEPIGESSAQIVRYFHPDGTGSMGPQPEEQPTPTD